MQCNKLATEFTLEASMKNVQRLCVVLLGAVVVWILAAQAAPAQGVQIKYWEDIWPFPDCTFDCQGNPTHDKCRCTTPADG